MAFKSAKDYSNDKYKNLFVLTNDGDYADVIFLYPSEDDVLIGDVHYIKSDEYNGYVHCLERGCPACSRGIRTQTKLFIPLYNFTTRQIEFWDRSQRFLSQLMSSVFRNYPNPVENVFRITRHGAAGDVNTSYQITWMQLSGVTFPKICQDFGVTFPDYYNTICKSMDAAEMSRILSSGGNGGGAAAGGVYSATGVPAYQVTPRVSAPSFQAPVAPPPAPVDIPEPIGDDDFNDTDDPPFTPDSATYEDLDEDGVNF